jgi:transcriptional regulator with XRE-family HTH domain
MVLKTKNAVQIMNRRFGENAENRKKIEDFSMNIRVSELSYQARIAAGMTQEKFADLIGTNRSVIARLENSDYDDDSMKMLQKIAIILNKKISISWQEAKTSKISKIPERELKETFENSEKLLQQKNDRTIQEIYTKAISNLSEKEQIYLSDLILNNLTRKDLNVPDLQQKHKSLPHSIGMGSSGMGNLSERVDELLWQE